MPTYNFLNVNTNEEFDVFIKMSELDEFKKNHPEYKQIIGSPNIVSGVSTSKNYRVPDGFKEVLAKTAEAHPTSVLADRVGGKSIKQVRTEQIVDKYWKKSQGK
jgi:predicted RND superfamily exporter protein